MARLVDLEGDEDAEAEANNQGGEAADASNLKENPNVGLFSAALTCYPIVSQLASYLDLNSLHDLARTCRQFRANLLQYRSQLIEQTLRCENENANPARRLGNALHASFDVWTAYGRDGTKIGRITSGKLGACAHDLVGPCRRCGKIICRNCVLKAPPASSIRQRHRRLCKTDMKSPIDRLMFVERRYPSPDGDGGNSAITKPVARSPCTCDDSIWICQPCGHSLRAADTTYLRGWAWRTRYSTCGGLGAGLGEGNEGVECGRGYDCQAARELYQEIECDADELASLQAEMARAESEGREWRGGSYATQEIVGIGGAVKTKIQKRALVGAVVKEYEDERVSGKFLGREQGGSNRSWCSWCERVVLSKKDLDWVRRSSESVASSSSGDD
ncbi:hypothetical protein BAUCODRAFT_78023 [Baudoinia panamericana UAMH 10762]|uniref:F-box domain-containing protein n=1 Tax=Baudoinia panamericana (strain UAMH 10762) TaxID=717646 RepID=M2M753_BAUPA|nr:uncharacterized protein BAUCODRAFT_78023 [Baudoinia panamericana UAMH 10762]EMC92131.1 hypothetical protein BAUCODRAFT_78023 [Baudoinia panamericana UAMH 10762]